MLCQHSAHDAVHHLLKIGFPGTAWPGHVCQKLCGHHLQGEIPSNHEGSTAETAKGEWGLAAFLLPDLPELRVDQTTGRVTHFTCILEIV